MGPKCTTCRRWRLVRAEWMGGEEEEEEWDALVAGPLGGVHVVLARLDPRVVLGHLRVQLASKSVSLLTNHYSRMLSGDWRCLFRLIHICDDISELASWSQDL